MSSDGFARLSASAAIDRFLPDSDFLHVTEHQPSEELVRTHALAGEYLSDVLSASMSSENADEEDPELAPWVATEAEKDKAARDAARGLVKVSAAAKQPAKRPRERSEPRDVFPNLAEIFDNYDTPDADRVTICRSYATYVASMLPKKPRRKRAASSK
jgi:hypothetical protein